MNRGSQARLARAIQAEVAGARVFAAESREWQSATFSGLEHRIGVEAPTDAGGRLAGLSPEALRVPGEVVAELRVVDAVPADGGLRFTLEARTVLSCRPDGHGTPSRVSSFGPP